MNYPRSAYLHIPFCHRRCFYCDFPVIPLGDKARGDSGPGSSLIKSYLELLSREIMINPEGPSLATIYNYTSLYEVKMYNCKGEK